MRRLLFLLFLAVNACHVFAMNELSAEVHEYGRIFKIHSLKAAMYAEGFHLDRFTQFANAYLRIIKQTPPILPKEIEIHKRVFFAIAQLARLSSEMTADMLKIPNAKFFSAENSYIPIVELGLQFLHYSKLFSGKDPSVVMNDASFDEKAFGKFALDALAQLSKMQGDLPELTSELMDAFHAILVYARANDFVIPYSQWESSHSFYMFFLADVRKIELAVGLRYYGELFKEKDPTVVMKASTFDEITFGRFITGTIDLLSMASPESVRLAACSLPSIMFL